MRHCKQLEQLRGALIPARRTWDSAATAAAAAAAPVATAAAAAAWEIELPLKSDFSGCVRMRGSCNYWGIRSGTLAPWIQNRRENETWIGKKKTDKLSFRQLIKWLTEM